MGRYFTGDINGKFWFGTQASNDASFFGGEEYEPNYIEYQFDTDHLESIKEGLAKCTDNLAGYKTKLDEFFKDCKAYNDINLAKTLGVDEKKVKELLEWYARQILGKKILDSVKECGQCNFEAEL